MRDELKERITLGGDLDRSLREGYQLDLPRLFKEAWRLTLSSRLALFFAILAVIGLTLLSFRLVAFSGLLDGHAFAQDMLVTLVIAALLSPISSSLDMLGLRRALGGRVKPSMIFDYWGHFVVLAQTSLLINGIKGLIESLVMHMGVSETWLMIPIACFSMTMLYTIPLVLERGLSPARAMLTSFRLFIKGWSQLVLIYAVLVALFVLAMLPLGLGLIWMMPFYLIMNGLIYREVCGVRLSVNIQQTEAATHDKGSFVA